jgi:probable DNA metabolism protein
MTVVVYNGSYEGFLTAVFEIYEFKFADIVFAKNIPDAGFLFAEQHTVTSDEVKSKRVLKGLQKKLSPNGLQNVYLAFLSEQQGIEQIVFRFIQYVLATDRNVEQDFGNTIVNDFNKAVKICIRESHRMKAFVRFQLTKDNLYYALVEPDCDVLPLIQNHFKNRYADQQWLIYDAKRRYGIYYDLHNVATVEMHFDALSNASPLNAKLFDEGEEFYQQLWRRYFSSVNIESRKNMKLHLQHMPRRYWKHLTEKIS